MSDADDFELLRTDMVNKAIRPSIRDERVLQAIESVPRHEFVDPEWRDVAYRNKPLPIGEGQTISQPYVVALMTEALNLKPEDRVLEIGTGSGYQTALIAEIVEHVYSVEIHPYLLEKANAAFHRLGYENITTDLRDGFGGWPEHAPFDAIIVTAAPQTIPRELVQQLTVGGRMILPLGDDVQELVLIKKTKEGLESRECGGVRFVPMKEGVQQT